MKYLSYIVLIGSFLLSTYEVNSMPTTDAEKLGTIAGLAVACGATKKLENFELIASRILANQAETDAKEKEMVRTYMETKYNIMVMQKKDMQSCGEVLKQFNALPIFKSIVYADGSVKLPDGQWSKPIRKVRKKSK